MRHYLALAFLAAAPVAHSITLGFAWDAPADPSLIDETRLYASGSEMLLGVAPMPDTTIYIDMGDLPAGRYCFVATHAATDDGITHESGFSNEVCLRMPGKPEKLRRQK